MLRKDIKFGSWKGNIESVGKKKGKLGGNIFFPLKLRLLEEYQVGERGRALGHLRKSSCRELCIMM